MLFVVSHLPFPYNLYIPRLRQSLIFFCPYILFSRTSFKWNHTACSLFCVRLTSCSMTLKFMQVDACIISSFFLLVNSVPSWINENSITYSSVDGHLDCFSTQGLLGKSFLPYSRFLKVLSVLFICPVFLSSSIVLIPEIIFPFISNSFLSFSPLLKIFLPFNHHISEFF